MRWPPVLGWYVGLIRRAAEPRDPAAVERQGLAKDLYGSALPREGWGPTLWGFNAASMMFCAVATAVAGAWWISLLCLPVGAFAAARTIGTLREHYYF